MRWLFRIHLYTGLLTAAFLLLESVSGCLLVFAGDYDRWLHPSLWHVAAQRSKRSEQSLVDMVQRAVAARRTEGRIASIEIGDATTSQRFTLTDGTQLFVDPYRGSIRGIRTGPTGIDDAVGTILQLHVRLLAGERGEWIVDLATASLLVMIATGICVWFRRKTLRVRFAGSVRRINRDLHNATGLYASLFLFVLAATGLYLAFGDPINRMLGLKPWQSGPPPHSEPSATPPLPLDPLIARAEASLSGRATVRIDLPARPASALRVAERGLLGESTVYLDRFSGAVVRLDEFGALPAAYRVRVINRALHTGAAGGSAGKFVMFLASLLLALLVITGTTMWWQRIL